MFRFSQNSLYIFLFVFFLMSGKSYSCGLNAKKSCCKNEIGVKSEQKECCKNNNSKNKKNSCGGKCGHSNCTTSNVNFSIISLNELEIRNTHFNFSIEKPVFYHSETFTSVGFTSVWLPPKIQ